MTEGFANTLAEAARQALRPPLRDKRFWLVQALVGLIAALHLVADAGIAVPTFGIPHFATVGLFLVPVVYAALNFGLGGSVATATWVTVLSVPDIYLVDQPHDRLEDLIQLAIVDAVAVFVGHRAGRERQARMNLEAAQARTRSYAAKVLQAHEDERRRIAHELHDDPLQLLIYLSRKLDGANGPLDKSEVLHETRDLVRQVAARLRSTSQGLRPPSLDDLGLVPAVRQLCSQVEDRSHMKVVFQVSGQDRRLDPDVELGVYRIVQEAIHNAERHSAAAGVRVAMHFQADGLEVEVADDGIGFDPEADDGLTLGLPGMRERTELLDGRLTIRSRIGAGTTVRLQLVEAPEPAPADSGGWSIQPAGLRAVAARAVRPRARAAPARTGPGSPSASPGPTQQRS